MTEITPILVSALAGLLSGFVVSIPVGPINVTIVNEGAQRGFKWAMLIGAGAVLMEAVYCTIGLAGFASFLNSKLVKSVMELMSFVLMTFLGIRYLIAKSVTTHSLSADRVEKKLHPHSAFGIGFVRVLGNPSILLFWMAMAGTFATHEWVQDNWLSRGACVGGFVVGSMAWFTLLSYLISLKKGNFSERSLLLLSRISGACLLVVAGIIGIRIILLLLELHERYPQYR